MDQATAETVDVRGRAGHVGFGAGSHQEIAPHKLDSDTAKGSGPFLPTLCSRHLHPRPLCFHPPLPRSVVFPAHSQTVFPRKSRNTEDRCDATFLQETQPLKAVI